VVRRAGYAREVELLRRVVVFGRSVLSEDVMLSEGGSWVTLNNEDVHAPLAASKMVMRAGLHYVQFTVSRTRSSS
jgi:hypothetical protein